MSKARAKPSRGEGALQKASRDVVDAQFRSGMGHQPPPGERREPPVSRAVRTDNRFDGVERSWGGRGGGAEKGREACGRRCSISHAALLRVSISPHPLPSQVALSDCRIPHLHSFDLALSRFSFFFGLNGAAAGKHLGGSYTTHSFFLSLHGPQPLLSSFLSSLALWRRCGERCILPNPLSKPVGESIGRQFVLGK